MPRDKWSRISRCKRTETVVRRLRKIVGDKPIALVTPFTIGVIAIEPQDHRSLTIVEDTFPDGSEHSWRHLPAPALLVEQRYANDIVAFLREKGVYVP